MTRRGVLVSALALSVGGCAEGGAPPRAGRAPVGQEALPPTRSSGRPSGAGEGRLLDAVFDEVDRVRLVQPVADGFADVTRVAGESRAVDRFATTHLAPFVGTEVELVDLPRTGEVVVGLGAADGGWAVRGVVDGDGVVSLEVEVAGRTTTISSPTARRADAGRTLALVVCENRATVLVLGRDDRWSALATDRDTLASSVDLRRDGALHACEYLVGVRRGSARLGRFRGGTFGMLGLRDPRMVLERDGTPMTRGGRHLMTWTCAGAGFFQQAHLAVFEVDPRRPRSMRLVSHVFSRRSGRVLGDHAGQLVRTDDGWLLLASSWGDFDGAGVHVRHGRSTTDLLTGVHVVDTEPTSLPTSLDTWDPSVARAADGWVLAYVVSPSQRPFAFRPATATTSAASPVDDLRPLAEDRSRDYTEGPVLVRDDAGWHVLASDGRAKEHVVYDLALRQQGVLRAPYGSNIPHAQLLPDGAGGWTMLSFDGTDPFEDVLGYGGHGDVVVLRSRPLS